MEVFFSPKNKKYLIKWLLEEAKRNDRTIVLEYAGNKIYPLLLQKAAEENLPESALHNYHRNYKLTAVVNPVISNQFINTIFKCSVLSLHENKKTIFLAADDFHKDCFSCSIDFYNRYYQLLKTENLIKGTYHINE